MNHDASLFEISYTYAERSAGTFEFEALAPLGDALVKLTLARTDVSDEDLLGLADFEGIEFFDLGRTEVGDAARSNKRVQLMCVALVLMVAASAFNLVAANQVKGVYSANDLYALSPMLMSGYRTEDGKGPLFMGTMGPSWDDLERPQRKEVASNLRDRLAPDGIGEVMLYDQRRTLQVHYVGKRNQYPGCFLIDQCLAQLDQAIS